MKRILVIDDDWLMLKTIKLILEKEGFEVDIAQDGEQGLDFFEEKKFDLVITDVLMPRKNGIDTITEIKKKNKNFPIIAISGAGQNGTMSYLSLAELAGATQTLAKPFCTKAFICAVHDCLGKVKPRVFSPMFLSQKKKKEEKRKGQ